VVRGHPGIFPKVDLRVDDQHLLPPSCCPHVVSEGAANPSSMRAIGGNGKGRAGSPLAQGPAQRFCLSLGNRPVAHCQSRIASRALPVAHCHSSGWDGEPEIGARRRTNWAHHRAFTHTFFLRARVLQEKSNTNQFEGSQNLAPRPPLRTLFAGRSWAGSLPSLTRKARGIATTK